MSQSAIAEELESLPGDLPRNWGGLVALGVVSTLLGLFGLWSAFWLTLAGVLMFGALLALGGGLQLFDAFKCKGWKSTFAHGGIAFIYLIVGGLMIFDPVGAAVALTLVLGVALLTAGSLRLVIAFQHRNEIGWKWAAGGGLLSMLLGALVLVQWPVSGVWLIGLVIAIELLINGWTAIFLGLVLRRAKRLA
ncbi:hypothetical protein ThidrDRAFT_1919 [Thiorhodococcus drewsii AZ1]|uniref:HdeD protein n=1 Tax=Thiorhodococcus drewsii AZ1 TaxID=765913 RepID=G2E0U6_9GAMM|nr:DUF308 domain-containing protein [Thiorhodococcus drewsii]EGV31718.1 hypothetical protein ThidrDRAFT_1919 [Thiorhodococcus drewsii AZ1]